MAKKTVTSKKRNVRVNAIGQLHVHSSFNNIIVSLANDEGQVISWSSAGKMGFRGSKKNTPYAAQMAAEDCAKVAYDLGLRKVKAYVKGPGNGRESAIRAIHGAGIEIQLDAASNDYVFILLRLIKGVQSAQMRSDLSRNLQRLERLGYVIVRAEVDPKHALRQCNLCGDHDNGDILLLSANGLDELVAVDFRHHDVHQRQIHRMLLQQRQRLCAIVGLKYRDGSRLQIDSQ